MADFPSHTSSRQYFDKLDSKYKAEAKRYAELMKADPQLMAVIKNGTSYIDYLRHALSHGMEEKTYRFKTFQMLSLLAIELFEQGRAFRENVPDIDLDFLNDAFGSS